MPTLQPITEISDIVEMPNEENTLLLQEQMARWLIFFERYSPEENKKYLSDIAERMLRIVKGVNCDMFVYNVLDDKWEKYSGIVRFDNIIVTHPIENPGNYGLTYSLNIFDPHCPRPIHLGSRIGFLNDRVKETPAAIYIASVDLTGEHITKECIYLRRQDSQRE